MREFLARFARNRGAVIGAAVLAAVALLALLAPVLFPGSPWDIDGRPFQRPFESPAAPLGTDTLGRDIAAGIAHGARVTLLLSLVSTAVALSIGVVLGAFAGYYGGVVDDAIMRFTEFFQTIPNFILLVVLVAIFTPSIASIVVAIGVVSWPPLARIVRGEFLSL
ncbi:MAG TPA: ABC transporter permease, partial [Geminicoccaceae bacterium]|nr:ABC transporter permease [Geminicoccaceae bacterium]